MDKKALIEKPDGELFVRLTEKCGTLETRLYPLVENKFGIKRYSFGISFGDGTVTYVENTCKKL